VRLGSKPGDIKNIPVGQIGWGITNPQLGQDKSLIVGEPVNKQHVKHWDTAQHQRFLHLTGKFIGGQDKQLEINPEIFHLMNTSAQRISIKSLDMQR